MLVLVGEPDRKSHLSKTLSDFFTALSPLYGSDIVYFHGDITGGIMASISGTSDDDVLKGTSLQDEIMGLEGDDTIDAVGGDDTVYGGNGGSPAGLREFYHCIWS